MGSSQQLTHQEHGRNKSLEGGTRLDPDHEPLANDLLCSRCVSLNLSRHKFTARKTVTTSSTTVEADFDSVGLDPAELGHLDDIYRNRVSCSFCRLIYNASHSDNGSGIGHDGLNAEGQRIDCKIEWHLDSRNADSKPTTRRLRVFSDDASFAEFYVVPILPSSLETSSLLGRRKDEGIMDSSLLSAWYTSCLNGHDNCQKHQESGSPGMTNPTRLIDVDSMRLVELETQTPPASRIPYAALSYVWGRHQQLRLTKATYEAFRSWIPEDRLPKTVRNAITIVRDLGIGYIWVDALCIKQDDAADWEIEAALMDRAYRQATLTICVAYGSDSGFGIPGPVASLISATPWDSRAWTFQERLLSTRCAIFTAEGMLWQCPTTTWREDIESALSKPVWTLDSVASPLQALQGNPLRSYTSCVSIYSGRKLTILNDKLAAFDGLGQVLGRRLHSRLVCGIPARYLDWALLWEPETASERIVKFPSWSWCGWNERVGWRLPTVEGTLFNLQNWLADHTWIVWYVGARGKWALVWDSKYPMSTVPSLQRWSGYTAGIYDPYGRSEDAAGCRYKANLKISTSATQDLLSSHGAISDFLLFQTFTGFFSLSRKSMSKSAFKSNLESGLHRFGITDSSGDWCGTIILDSTWFNSVGGVFEFAAISDAKEFSLEELDTWTYYIPEERQQAEWYCFYALMLRWRGNEKGRFAERVGLAKIFQSSFFSSFF